MPLPPYPSSSLSCEHITSPSFQFSFEGNLKIDFYGDLYGLLISPFLSTITIIVSYLPFLCVLFFTQHHDTAASDKLSLSLSCSLLNQGKHFQVLSPNYELSGCGYYSSYVYFCVLVYFSLMLILVYISNQGCCYYGFYYAYLVDTF